MSSNIEIDDINAPWNKTPKYFAESYFESNEKRFQRWIFENFKSFIEDVEFHNKGPEWNRLKWDIINSGSSQYNSEVDAVLSEYRENVSLESYKELQKLRSEIVRDCEFFLIENDNAIYDPEVYAGMEHYDFAHLPWDGNKYPVLIQSVYDGTIRKVDILLEYYESIGINTEQSNETTNTVIEEQTVATDAHPKYSANWSDYALKYSYLTIILDYNATGKTIPYEKKALIEVATDRLGDKKKAKSLTRRSYEIRKKIDLNSELDIENEFGEDWRKIVLALSEHPDELSTYLKKKYL